MANGLAKKTSVISIKVDEPFDGALISALTTALPSNSTLRELTLMRCYDCAIHLSQIFLALGNNLGLKTLIEGAFGSVDESLCTAIKDGLGMNETLECLEVKYFPVGEDNNDLWCRAFSFLRNNKVLKSLVIEVQNDCFEPDLLPFRVGITSLLEESTSLENLSIFCGYPIKADEEYFEPVTVLQNNATLKSLKLLQNRYNSIRLNDNEDKQMAALLKKNYALERLSDIDHTGLG